jgi:hypothetical protein
MHQKSESFRFGFLIAILGAFLFCAAPRVEAQTPNVQGTLKAFVLTSTYGVLAGGLTGLASLAFYKEASEHTRNIAIGASVGLYTGILLGAYIVYSPSLSTPSSPESPEEEDKEEPDPNDPINLGASLETPPRMIPTLSYLPQQGVQLGVVYRF